MATTFLQLTNRVLTRMNEVNLTSSNFATATGASSLAQQTVNDAIRMILTEEQEWPFTISNISQTLTSGTNEYAHSKDLVDWESFAIAMPNLVTNGDFTANITSWSTITTGTGTAVYTATGNGRARLTSGTGTAGITQGITTVAHQKYRVRTKIYSGNVSLLIGTSSGGSQISTTTLVQTDNDRGDYSDVTFTATTSSTFITYKLLAINLTSDIDQSICFEDVTPRKLEYKSYNQFLAFYKALTLQDTSDSFKEPTLVYPTADP